MKKLMLITFILIGKHSFAQIDTVRVIMQVFYRTENDTTASFTSHTQFKDFEQVTGFVIRKGEKLYYRKENFEELPQNSVVFKAMKL